VEDNLMNNFEAGEVYYCVKYSDGKMLYPVLETFVFLGTHSQDTDSESLWYFQPADSFAQFGSVFESEEGDRKCWELSKDKLEDMVDLSGLCDELEAAAERRAKVLKLKEG
jgi:hypothetical protein